MMTKEEFHSGFVAVLGVPNVGKSTLVNRILQTEISIISPKAQTTRNKIQGIYTDQEQQIIFLDTPGLHRPHNNLDQYMDQAAWSAVQDVDAILLLVSATQALTEDTRTIITKLADISVPIFLVINKIDLVHPDALLPLIDQYQQLHHFQEIFPISATQGNNVAELLTAVGQILPVGPKYYPEDQISDHPEYFVVSEIIREKILELTRQEVPHAVAVVVEDMQQRLQDKLQVQATIYVERASQKQIIIGSKGSMLKNIGIRARKKIELLLGERINLQLWVKVQKNWRNDPLFLARMGYAVKDLK